MFFLLVFGDSKCPSSCLVCKVPPLFAARMLNPNIRSRRQRGQVGRAPYLTRLQTALDRASEDPGDGRHFFSHASNAMTEPDSLRDNG